MADNTPAAPTQPLPPAPVEPPQEGDSTRSELEWNPKYSNGRFTTKYLADDTDCDNLENTNFLASYHGKCESDSHKIKYKVRTAFNNEQAGLDSWFAEACSKVKSAKYTWTVRAVLNPNAYFSAAFKYHLPADSSVKVGLENQLGKIPRHYVRVNKRFNQFKLNLTLSGDCCGQDKNHIVDTISLVPAFIKKAKDENSPFKKIKVYGQLDLDVSEGKIQQKRDFELITHVALKKGFVDATIDLDKKLELYTTFSAYHHVAKHLGLYLAYRGSLTKFDGEKTIGTQITVPDHGRIRTSLNSNMTLKNVFLYNVHPFATIVQHTQFNVKTKSDLHFGLGLALGNN